MQVMVAVTVVVAVKIMVEQEMVAVMAEVVVVSFPAAGEVKIEAARNR